MSFNSFKKLTNGSVYVFLLKANYPSDLDFSKMNKSPFVLFELNSFEKNNTDEF